MEYGAAMTVSELISANALVRDSQKTFDMLPMDNEPRPVAAQIFGGEPEVVRDAAVIVDERFGCDVIDLNFGCPVKKVTKAGAGAAMMKDPAKAERMVKAVVSSVKKPVTVKTRIGWDFSSINVVDFLRAIEDAGAAAVAVHGRTASQGYSGLANWDVIAEVAEALSIPVIGNGDIDTPEKALHRLRPSGCAMVMIGRGALGAPWVFRRINSLLAGEKPRPVTPDEMKEIVLRHLDLMAERYGERLGVRKMRAHLGYYTKGLKNSARFREAANGTACAEDMRELIANLFDSLESPAELSVANG